MIVVPVIEIPVPALRTEDSVSAVPDFVNVRRPLESTAKVTTPELAILVPVIVIPVPAARTEFSVVVVPLRVTVIRPVLSPETEYTEASKPITPVELL